MLGFELKGTAARPNILILEEHRFKMCYMNELDLNTSTGLMEFVKLIIAISSFVTYESQIK